MSPSSDGSDYMVEFVVSPESAFDHFHAKSIIDPEQDKVTTQLSQMSMSSEDVLNKNTLTKLTVDLVNTYRRCNPEFSFSGERVPRRALSKNPNPAKNDGHDNSDDDYILYAKEILGEEEGRRYLVDDMLGQGTFGQVVSCICLTRNQKVAVKVIKNQPPYHNQALVEIDVLKKLVSVSEKGRFVKLIDTFTHKKHLCLVFELLGVSLLELIVQNQYRGLSLNLVRVITRQLLDSLIVLEENRIIHCDLKPENVLFESVAEAQIKVIDFGSSCYFGKAVYSYIQSRFYRSPEVILGISYGASIDMWSLGCISAELFLGIPLFPGSSAYNMLARIIEMIGQLPHHMLMNGRFTKKYYHQSEDQEFKFKSEQEYSEEMKTPCPPSKKYFSAKSIPELIDNYPIKKSLALDAIEKEKLQRRAFTDFLLGVLQIDPTVRWTPKTAREHPFVTGKPFTEPYKPLPEPKSGGPTVVRVRELERKTDHILKSPVVDPKSFSKPSEQQSKPIPIHQKGVKSARPPGFDIELSLGSSPSTNNSVFREGASGSFKGLSGLRANQSNPGLLLNTPPRTLDFISSSSSKPAYHHTAAIADGSVLNTPVMDRAQLPNQYPHEMMHPSMVSPSHHTPHQISRSIPANDTSLEPYLDHQSHNRGDMQAWQSNMMFPPGFGYPEDVQHFETGYHPDVGYNILQGYQAATEYYGPGWRDYQQYPPQHPHPSTHQMYHYMPYAPQAEPNYTSLGSSFPSQFSGAYPPGPWVQQEHPPYNHFQPEHRYPQSYQQGGYLGNSQPPDEVGAHHQRYQEFSSSTDEPQSRGQGGSVRGHIHSFGQVGRGRGGYRHVGDRRQSQPLHIEAQGESKLGDSQAILPQPMTNTQKPNSKQTQRQQPQHLQNQRQNERDTWNPAGQPEEEDAPSQNAFQIRPRAYSTGSRGRRGGWTHQGGGRGAAAAQQQAPKE